MDGPPATLVLEAGHDIGRRSAIPSGLSPRRKLRGFVRRGLGSPRNGRLGSRRYSASRLVEDRRWGTFSRRSPRHLRGANRDWGGFPRVSPGAIFDSSLRDERRKWACHRRWEGTKNNRRTTADPSLRLAQGQDDSARVVRSGRITAESDMKPKASLRG